MGRFSPFAEMNSDGTIYYPSWENCSIYTYKPTGTTPVIDTAVNPFIWASGRIELFLCRKFP